MKAEALVDTLSEVVTKTIAITLTCVKAEALVKTEADTLEGEKAYMCLDTQNEVEAKAQVYTRAHTFPQVKAKSVTNTLRDMEAETALDTLTNASRVRWKAKVRWPVADLNNGISNFSLLRVVRLCTEDRFLNLAHRYSGAKLLAHL